MKSTFKTGDEVKVLSGDDKGKTGKVLVVNRAKGKVLVEGINMLTHYERKSEQKPQGAILKKEGYIPMCKVAKVASAKEETAKPSTKKETKKSLTKKA